MFIESIHILLVLKLVLRNVILKKIIFCDFRKSEFAKKFVIFVIFIIFKYKFSILLLKCLSLNKKLSRKSSLEKVYTYTEW